MEKLKSIKPRETEETAEIAVGRARPVIGSDTPFVIKEAYKTARTNIMFALGDCSEGKVIVMTSAMPGDGKTTTCINIAATFAQQPGVKVLLIDGDMRRPRINRTLSLENKEGLANLLAGFCDYKTFRPQKTEYGFDCITAGTVPPNPSELLSSEKAVEIFEHFSKQYDYVFLDTPPVTVVSDAVISKSFADGVILVVREKYTSYDTIEKAVAALNYAEVKILGTVLNDVEISDYKYNYKYGGRYASRYYEDVSGEKITDNSMKFSSVRRIFGKINRVIKK